MTRIFTEGAEMNDILFWDVANGDISVISAAPAPYQSAFAYKIGSGIASCSRFISAINECYIRNRVYFTNSTAGIPTFVYEPTALAWMGIDGAHHPYVATPDGTLATATETVTFNQWYLFEIYFKMADAGGRFVVYMDGTKVIDFTGDTKYGAYTVFDSIAYIPDHFLGSSVTTYIDDLALNDTNGASDNSYCGDGVVIKVTPDGNGTHNNWHGSDGDSIDNYLLVDEYPHDGDVTYVYHDGAETGEQQQFTLSDYDGTGKTILRIYPEVRARKTAAAAYKLKLGTLAVGGTDAMSLGRNLTQNYARYVGNEQTVNPVDSGAWQEADIDALELVLEVG